MDRVEFSDPVLSSPVGYHPTLFSGQILARWRLGSLVRNIVTARNTKNGRPRDIPINDDVRDALAELCRDKGPNDYIFVSPKNKKSCLQETKKGFHTACRLAGIQGLIWKDPRATFGFG